MVVCPDCGKDVPESKFCKNCGAYIKDVEPVEKIGHCSNCGGEIEMGNKFCPECGVSISGIEEVKAVKETEVLDKSSEAEANDSVPITIEQADEGISSDSDDLKDAIPVSIHEDDDLETTDSVPLPIKHEDTEISNNPENEDAVKKIKFCFNCGNKLIGDFKFCPECGQKLNGDVAKSQTAPSSGEKNILLAIILSAVLPGLGQIYLGLDHKGAIFLIAYVISAILILILIGFLLCILIWIWALVDTIISTNALNRGDEVQDKIL